MLIRRTVLVVAAAAAIVIAGLAVSPAANATPTAPASLPPAGRTTVMPPSDPSGRITYIVLDAQGEVAESTVGQPGPLARSMGATTRTAGAAPAISQPSACGTARHDLDLLRQDAKSYCFNGQGGTAVTVTNVTEIRTGSSFVADIHYHLPGQGVASNIVVVNPNQDVFTGAVHWTADDESLV